MLQPSCNSIQAHECSAVLHVPESACLYASNTSCGDLLTLNVLVMLTVNFWCLQPDHIKNGYCPRIPGERLPASYINHYIANGGAVVPRFGGYSADRDAEAVRVLQEAYGPERKVVNVYSREILLNAGNVHCITQQNPAPRD